ncbi:MAG: SIS domain-containing protein [Acidobacteria bacterium]|nr:MAG: SIS domain-containing protein [Acidobacteriota bacterium]
MAQPGILHDILGQPASLQKQLEYLRTEGQPALKVAAEHLRQNGGRIILSGMGASLFACLPLSLWLGRHGILAPVIETSDLLHYQRELCRKATLVLVSRSGRTIETTKLLNAVSPRDCHVIGVTAVTDSPLAEQSQNVIEIRTTPDTMVSIQSYPGTVLALLALGAAAVGQFDDSWQSRAAALIDPWERSLEEQLKASKGWRDFFANPRVIYLTGRGPSLASALQGALLFNEVAKVPAAGVSAANFRHGPVEIVNPDFRGLIFATQAATNQLDIGLARDVERFGGQVRVIGPTDALRDKLPAASIWPIANVPEPFGPVIEVSPIQIAAYRIALWRNVELDKFQYAGPVALNEENLGG